MDGSSGQKNCIGCTFLSFDQVTENVTRLKLSPHHAQRPNRITRPHTDHTNNNGMFHLVWSPKLAAQASRGLPDTPAPEMWPHLLTTPHKLGQLKEPQHSSP